MFLKNKWFLNQKMVCRVENRVVFVAELFSFLGVTRLFTNIGVHLFICVCVCVGEIIKLVLPNVFQSDGS